MKMIIYKPKDMKKYCLRPGWLPAIDQYIGQTVTISHDLGENIYEVEENPWSWHKNWLKTPLEYFIDNIDT